MSCRRAQVWIDESLDGAGLSRERQARLEAHLAACPGCRTQWQALGAAEQALRAPRPVAPPAAMLADFKARLAEAERPAPAHTRPGRPWGWLWALAPVAAAGTAALLFAAVRPSLPVVQPAPDRTARYQATPLPAGPDRMLSDERLGRGREAAPSASSPASPSPRSAAGPPAPAKPKAQPRGEELMARNTPLPTPAPAAPERGAAGVKDRAAGFVPVVPAPPAAGAPVTALGKPLDEAGRSDPAGPKPDGALVERPVLLRAESEKKKPAEPVGSGRGTVAAAPATNGAFGRKPPGYTALALEDSQLPLEFDVSPAVLTALQRPVEVRLETVPLRTAARDLAEQADVVVTVDPKVPVRSVSLTEAQVPLWKVLEGVARQGNLVIYPEANQIVLRPAGAEAARMARFAGAQGPPAARQQAQVRARLSTTREPEAKPARSAGGAQAGGGGLGGGNAPGAGGLGGYGAAPAAGSRDKTDLAKQNVADVDRAVAQGQQAVNAYGFPDRTVWAADWGLLPERGFAPPTTDEFANRKLEVPSLGDQQAPLYYKNTPPAKAAAPAEGAVKQQENARKRRAR